MLATRHGVWVGNWINWTLITTSNCNILTDLYTIQINNAHAKSQSLIGDYLAPNPLLQLVTSEPRLAVTGYHWLSASTNWWSGLVI
jgi:hypothetical protein